MPKFISVSLHVNYQDRLSVGPSLIGCDLIQVTWCPNFLGFPKLSQSPSWPGSMSQMSSPGTGTNSWPFRGLTGTPTSLSASYPVRYMHTTSFWSKTFKMPFIERHFSAILRLVILLSVFDIQSPSFNIFAIRGQSNERFTSLYLQACIASLF